MTEVGMVGAPAVEVSTVELSAAEVPAANNLDRLAYPDNPELIVGIVAPIGTPLKYFKRKLAACLKARNFTVLDLKLSKFAATTLAPGDKVADLPAYPRYKRLMGLGNDLRRYSNRDDTLALFAAAEINAGRPEQEPQHFAGTAIVIDQLKRPEEVFTLRRIYGEHFLLIGLYCPKDIRIKHLEQLEMDAREAAELIGLDEDDATKSGQRVSDTFHLADVFIEVHGNVADSEEGARIEGTLDRFWDAVFGRSIVTPTREEFGMYLAHAASLRSASLARQVGAAIVSEHSELLSVGANDIPTFPGGLYWGDETDEMGESRDHRDHQLGYDESDRMKREIVREILPILETKWDEASSEARQKLLERALLRLKGTRVLSLTEFARAVHAEMEALSSAVRVGVSVRGGTLYSTTFPCHNCAKHIVASGIKRVWYIEPYPKSRAVQMYGDSIFVSGESSSVGSTHKVEFRPFVGIAPRRYPDLFSRASYEGRQWEYKDKQTGELKVDELRLRIPFSPMSYVLRESLAALDLKPLKERINAHRPTSDSADVTKQ